MKFKIGDEVRVLCAYRLDEAGVVKDVGHPTVEYPYLVKMSNGDEVGFREEDLAKQTASSEH